MFEMTREAALRLHREMWSDMKEKLGDNPSAEERALFKIKWCGKWCYENGFKAVEHNCFLCAYCGSVCAKCPINWDKAEGIGRLDDDFSACMDPYIKCNEPFNSYWKSAPISLILAIPEREGKDK